jgi:hypothetical protein
MRPVASNCYVGSRREILIVVLFFLQLETSYNKTCLQAISSSSFGAALNFGNVSPHKNTNVLQTVCDLYTDISRRQVPYIWMPFSRAKVLILSNSKNPRGKRLVVENMLKISMCKPLMWMTVLLPVNPRTL